MLAAGATRPESWLGLLGFPESSKRLTKPANGSASLSFA